MATLLHPSFFAHMSAFFPQTCNIIERGGMIDSYGAMTSDWKTVEGMASVQCALAIPTGGKQWRSDMSPTIIGQQIVLAGYFPNINESMRAVVDGSTYDIMLVEHNPTHEITRLTVQKATVVDANS
jgi:hypothetical protein